MWPADCHDRHELTEGWECAATEPDACEDSQRLDGLRWMPAVVPGTAAAALRASGAGQPGDEYDFDRQDWWFRTRFECDRPGAAEKLVLALDGLATVCEVYLNGRRVLDSASMFAGHTVEVTEFVQASNELSVRCRALAPLLAVPRRPRARWRTRLAPANLRFFRTMLLGRAPGFAPGPAVVGPWRPVRLERRRVLEVQELRLRAGGDGRVAVFARLRPLPGAGAVKGAELELSGPAGAHRVGLVARTQPDGVELRGGAVIAGAERWWPHTHGDPVLYQAALVAHTDEGEVRVGAGRVGFRSLTAGTEIERDGVQLRVNETPVFARGAVWTPLDLALPTATEAELRAVLERVAAAGMNTVRVPGIACYESDQFYDLCDELGILIWQDFMFANFDYPEQDPQFMAAVEGEARQVLSRLAHRPSLAVLCGGSEVAQQVAMLGLDPALASGPLYHELLPALVEDAEVDAAYVPSTPCGGDLPFRTDRGVANYYGVGAYRRSFEDVRRSEVRFAAECLALANVPDEPALEGLAAAAHDPRWKRGVPRDTGAGWDFEDVRDHYLRSLFGADPVALRSVEHERYLDLSRAVSGEVMSEVFGEWRRAGSPCGGGLVLWLKDIAPGAGWGLLDHRGEPKVAYHHLRRLLAPVAVWSTDEGLGGIVAHVANDRGAPLRANLRVAFYRDLETRVEEVVHALALDPHGGWQVNVEELLGRFVDAAWAYRFGPPQVDVIAISLEDGDELLSQCFRMPVGRPAAREPATRLGLTGHLDERPDGSALLSVHSDRFAYGVRPAIPGFLPDDDAFSVEPGGERRLRLHRVAEDAKLRGGTLTALNLAGRVSVST